jgi:hypothetical protein
MKSRPTHVYCFQLGDTNCFKIGHSIEPDDRKCAFKTASPVEFIERRREPSPHAEELENYIHYLLEPRRVKHRRELFDVTMEEVTEAFEQAIPIVNETQRLLAEADALGKKKPSNDVMLDASQEVLELYEQLRRAWRDEYVLDRHIGRLESKIKLATGDNLGIANVFEWRWRSGGRINIKALRHTREKLYRLLLRRFHLDTSHRHCDWA